MLLSSRHLPAGYFGCFAYYHICVKTSERIHTKLNQEIHSELSLGVNAIRAVFLWPLCSINLQLQIIFFSNVKQYDRRKVIIS